MLSLSSVLRLVRRGRSLPWGQTVCGAVSAHSRLFATETESENDALEISDGNESVPFNAAVASAPFQVHQLIGDPRTGVADDTTTAPWGDDVSVEWVYSDPEQGVDWYRYSEAGPMLPHMYMDSRLSDHSKNLMYMLRCKDPARWTIPALADKFSIRRQRVMAILALKEMQAHRLNQGRDMQGPLQPYAYRIPLQDFHIQQDGEPVDLAQLVRQQEQQQQQQQQQDVTDGKATVAAAADDSLGSLEDFLATDSSSSSSNEAAAEVDGTQEQQKQQQQQQQQHQQQPTALSSLAAAAGGQAADLAALMPRIAAHTQQLELQLLQLLQQHHYSSDELQQRLLQQVDQAEAYYNAHIAGTPLQQVLATEAAGQEKQPAAAAAAGEASAVDSSTPAASSKAIWLDFDAQRDQIKQLMQQLSPLLQYAGAGHDREVGRLVAQLRYALHQASQNKAADTDVPETSDIGPLQALVKSAERSGLFAAAYNQLDSTQCQQLLDLLPEETKIALNIQGVDLRSAISAAAHRGNSLGGVQGLDSSQTSVSQGLPGSFEAPGSWPGSVPAVIDVWGYEEVPRQQLTALQQQLKPMKQLLDAVSTATAADQGSGSKNHSPDVISVDDVAAVQQGVRVYSGLVHEYDQVLAEQAAELVGSGEPPILHPAAQRRLIRILRDIDMNALDKLLLWESLFKEKHALGFEAFGGRPGKKSDAADQSRLRRLKRQIQKALRLLDERGVAAGQPDPWSDYPELPASVPSHERVSVDWATAHLDAEVVGRQFHRGSGDRHFKRVESYPAFEGYSLEEFDRTQEGELSAITRLASEREDNMMWKEFRHKLLRNFALLAPDLHQHLKNARPPKPRQGWSFVVHPVGAEARKHNRWLLEQRKRDQYLDVDTNRSWYKGVEPGQLGSVRGFDPARNTKAPAEPYVAMPGRKFRGLKEEEQVVVGYSRARPRRKMVRRG